MFYTNAIVPFLSPVALSYLRLEISQVFLFCINNYIVLPGLFITYFNSQFPCLWIMYDLTVLSQVKYDLFIPYIIHLC